MECTLDLTLSGGQFHLRTRPLAEGDLHWGAGNRAQGVAWLEGLVLLDPLADEEFGADVIVRAPARFSPDKRAQRRLQVPLSLGEGAGLTVGSPAEDLPVPLALAPGDYTLVYEVCLGRDVFYVLTLLAQPCTEATALQDDGWGLKRGQVLAPGLF